MCGSSKEYFCLRVSTGCKLDLSGTSPEYVVCYVVVMALQKDEPHGGSELQAQQMGERGIVFSSRSDQDPCCVTPAGKALAQA